MNKDLLIGGGIIASGLGLGLAAHIAQEAARRRMRDLTESSMAAVKRTEISRRAINELRSAAHSDVNIGRMRSDLQDAGMADNAYYTGNPDYKSHVDKLITDEVTGGLGTIAIGDKTKLPSTIAHELGHSENNRTGRMKRRVIGSLIGGGIGLASTLGGLAYGAYNRYGNKGSKDNLLRDGMIVAGLSGVGAAVGDYIANQSVVSEEEQASKNALKYLRRVGRSSDQLCRDKELLEAALDTYRTHRNWGVISSLGLAGAGLGGAYLLGKLS